LDQEHQVSKKITEHFIPALLALVVFFSALPFIESIMRLRSTAQEAITWHGVEVITKTVKPGDVLELVYMLTVNKQCPADLRGFIVAPDGSVPIRLPTIVGGYARPSNDQSQVRVRIPIPKTSDPGLAPLTSGKYTYRTMATRYCHDGVENDNAIPDAQFNLDVAP
jgi:hypothetical protein